MRILIVFLLFVLCGCTTEPKKPAISGSVIRISEISPDKWTALARQNLEQLIQIYHLDPILFTRDINIQSNIETHSHPILSLNTRYAEYPNKLLSVFVHEQLHWWVDHKKQNVDKAIHEMKKIFPVLPKDSTYLHLIICFLEYDAMIHYLKLKEANKILKDFIYKDKINSWINTQVYLKFKTINFIIKRNKLSPIPKHFKALTKR